MDQQEPGVDQRKQLLAGKRNKRGRSPAEWDEIAIKVMLISSEWAAWVRDNYSWQQYGRAADLRKQTVQLMAYMELANSCQPSTFINAVARSLRRMRREARQSLSPEARNRDYSRNNQR